MKFLVLWIALLSLVTLARQNLVHVINPYDFWAENDNIDNLNYQNRHVALGQVTDRSSNSDMYNQGTNGVSRFRPYYFQAQQNPRFFGGMLLSSMFPNLLSSLVRTSYSFVATTPTTTVTSYCTEAIAFLNGAAAVPCARKRRGISMDELENLHPTAVLLPASRSISSPLNDLEKRDVAIMSSKEEEAVQFPTTIDIADKQVRLIGTGSTVVVTTLAKPVLITSTVTILSAVINAAGAVVQCIPPGGVVCA